ncbi:hypothetical protein KY284_024631 [Solanum tuberosum]|nr:hypothetical protein KY284_024631 [Solanum tuberosum]
MYSSSCVRPKYLCRLRFSWSISKHFSDDKSFSPLFDCFHIRLEHSAQLLKMRENFLPLRNVYLCRYLQRDLYPHCNNSLSSSFNLFNSFKIQYIILTVCVINCTLNAHKSMLLKMLMRFRIATNNSHRSFHSWKKGSINDLTVDELFPPNYVWHVQDPKGPWEGDDEVKVDDLSKAIFNSKLQYLILSVCVINCILNPHKSVFLKMIMRFRIETNNSRRSFHSWKKGSIDDENFAFKLIVDELLPPNYVWLFKIQKDHGKLQYLILSVCVIQLYLYVCVLKAEVGLNAHKSILLKIVMRFRTETNDSRRSFHSWKKGSIDDVLIPIESYHISKRTLIEERTEEVKVHDLNKAIFNSKVSCPNLKRLYIIRPNSISSLCSHQLQQTSITEGIRLWKIEKLDVSISGQREVLIDDFPEMKTFVQQGIFVSTPSLKWVNYDDKKSEASLFSAPRNKKLVKALPMVRCYDSRKLQEDEVMAALKSVCSLIPHKYRPMMKPDIVLLENEESCLVAEESRVRFLKYKPVMRLDIVLPESEDSCLVA